MSHTEQRSPSVGERTSPSAPRIKFNKERVERKKRASTACDCCRNRKIKCDVQEIGVSCSRCRSYGMLCNVPRDNRGKKKQLAKAQTSARTSAQIDEQTRGTLDGMTRMARMARMADILIPLPQASDESENSEEEGDDVSPLDGTHTHHLPTLINSVSYHGDLAASALNMPDASPRESSTEIPLPSYIKTRYNMNSDDLQYLWYEGALRIPDTPLKNSLLQSYIEYVHPSLPLINLHDFLSIICASERGEYVGEGQRISLLLFQAMLFAGSAFVDQISLEMAGFSTRREARAVFYQKVKLLYDFDYEVDDKLAVVQSLLLMTYWHEVASDGKDEWHWLGLAVSITTSFHNRAAIVGLDARYQKVWNRVWWCCFTRDRLLALGLRRTPKIEEDYCDSFTTPVLTLNDFEIQKFDVRNLTHSISECRVIQDTSLQLKLAKTFIAKAELCICIGHILRTQYYPQVRDHGIGSESIGKSSSRVVLLPNPKANGLEACENELAHWLQFLPTGMPCTTLTAERVATDGNSLIIEEAVLQMIYLVTLSTLHRPRAISAAAAAAAAATLQEHNLQITSRRIIRETSTKITKIHVELYELNLTRYLPTTAVTVLLPAIVSHIQNIKSSSNHSQIWEEAMKGLAQCMQILQKLRDNYQPADEAIHFLEDALRLANIQIVTEPMPTLNTSQTPTTHNYDREIESAEGSARLSPFVSPQRLKFSTREATSWQYASTPKAMNITNNDFQALDPGVSLLSKELAWLDNPSTLTTHPEPAINYDEGLDFSQHLVGNGMSIDVDFGTALDDVIYGSVDVS